MIIILYGDDTYRSKKRLERLRGAFQEKFDPSGVNIVHLDGEKLKPEGLNQHVAAQGFLATKRFVIVANLFSTGASDTQKAVLDMFKERDFLTDNIIVFWESGDPFPDAPARGKKNTRGRPNPSLWKELVNVAKKEHYPMLEPHEVGAWIVDEVKRRGGTIEKKSAQKLATMVGTDLWQAANEVEKLVHFSQGSVITDEVIDQLVAGDIDDNIFRLTDALGQRDLQQTLKMFEEQFLAGTEPLYLLRMFGWHLRNLISVRAMLNDGVQNPKIIAQKLSLHPFVAQKTARQAESFTIEELIWAYHELLGIDQAIKTSRADPRALFDLLAVRFLEKKRAPALSS